MKRLFITLILCITGTAACYAQSSFTESLEEIGPEPGALDSGTDGWTLAGMAGILLEEDPTTGETDIYAQVGFQPEFSLGPFGLGLNLILYYDIEEGEFRESEYNETEDYLKLIRYIRYGRHPKNDDIYLKAGALDAATLGHGFIINRYKTDVDYDNRRAGLICNLNYEYWGLETFTNNMFLGDVIGLRAIAKPLAGNPIPKINEIGFGFSYVTDRSAPFILQNDETFFYDEDNPEDSYWAAPPDDLPDWDEDGIFIVEDRDSITVWGADAEFPLFRGNMLGLNFYLDYAQMRNVGDESGAFSSGIGAGFVFNFKLTESNKLYLKAEKRFMDSNFIPGYFDSLYEIERVQFSTDFPLVTKQAYLASLPDDDDYEGIYAEAAFEILGTLQVWGTFQDNQDVPNDGSIKMGAGFKEISGISIAAEYTRKNIDDSDLNDMFTLDDRSIFLAYAAYKISVGLNAGVIFRREWALDETTGEYEPVDSYNAGIAFNTTF